MTGAHSRNKGARFEVAVANWLKTNGVTHAERRGVHTDDRGDIDGLPGVIIECKNVEQMSLGSWLDQANNARRHIGADLVVVVHKRRGKPDVEQAFFTMPADSWITLMTEAGRLP
jgi:hypothetical protein